MTFLKRFVYGSTLILAFGVLLFVFTNATSTASARDYSLAMFERLAGRPPSEAELTQMATLVFNGDIMGALDQVSKKPDFINLTARDFCQPMSTRSEVPDAQMNDFTAMCMGIIRDDRPATDFVTGNYYYYFRDTEKTIPNSVTDNYLRLWHYQITEGQDAKGFDYSAQLTYKDGQEVQLLPDNRTQVQPTGKTVPNPDPGGLMTTMTFTSEHATQGTNRRMVEFAFKEFLCRSVADFADVTADTAWIGRDVSRAPGNNPQIFESTCRGCHSQMDSLRGAFAYMSFGYFGQTWLKPPAWIKKEVWDQYNQHGDIYPQGHVTVDDSWVNNSNQGSNAAYFGWRGATSGRGIAEFGAMLGRSRAFSRCMIKRSIETICQRPTVYEDDAKIINNEMTLLEADNYNLRRLFMRVAANPQCINPAQAN